jgi:hypothetical protein
MLDILTLKYQVQILNIDLLDFFIRNNILRPLGRICVLRDDHVSNFIDFKEVDDIGYIFDCLKPLFSHLLCHLLSFLDAD